MTNIVQIEITPDKGPYWDEYIHEMQNYFQESFPDAISDDYDSGDEKLKNLLKKRYVPGHRIYYLWKRDGEYLGLANGYIEEENQGLLHELIFYIAEMTVAPSFRGKGMGKILVENLLDWAKKQGATKLRVEVNHHIEANSFWCKNFGLKLVSSVGRNRYEVILTL